MKKLLVLTSIYPGPDIPNNFTSIVHYFAKEWNTDENEVLVIHNLTYYHYVFYILSKLFGKIIANITGTNIPKKRLSKNITYKLDGIRVLRLPIYKSIPYSKFKNLTLKKHAELISNKLLDNNFMPDVVVGHWGNPQLKLLKLLKLKHPSLKTILTLHYDGKKLFKTYMDTYKNDLSYIDLLGFRNITDRNSFLSKHISLNKQTFICPSGIPDYFLSNTNNINSNFENFIFIGTLLKRKYPDIILDALFSSQLVNFKMTYIGSGFLYNSLKKRAKILNLQRIFFQHNIDRKQVINKLDNSDCLIMVSEGEAFGLVYLEAMSRGCITIGSINEGIDGVIINGYNGFLCEAGNKDDLVEKINFIAKLSDSEKIRIKKNAIKTAKKFTNSKVAIDYLNIIKSA